MTPVELDLGENLVRILVCLGVLVSVLVYFLPEKKVSEKIFPLNNWQEMLYNPVSETDSEGTD